MDQRSAAKDRIMSRARIPMGETGRITISQDPDGRWTARARFRDLTGQTRQLRRTGRTKGAAESALKRAFRDMRDAAQPSTRGEEAQDILTVGDLAEEWLERRKPGVLPVDPHRRRAGPPPPVSRFKAGPSIKNN